MSSPESSAAEHGCPKCGHDKVTTGSIATTGSGLSKLFDVQTNKFETVTCAQCGYTEFYKDTGSRVSDIADIFSG